MSGDLELSANVSLLFGELPYLERFGAAASAGFQSVESWWPFSGAVPTPAEVDGFVGAIGAAGIPLSGLNLYGGDLAAGERGVVSHPGRRAEFEANLEVVAGVAARTGCRVFNALYGQRLPGVREADRDATALANLSEAVARLDGTVLIEPLSRGLNGDYPLETARDAIAVVERVRDATGLGNIGLLFDTFHLANNGDDPLAVINEWAPFIAHVQLADAPGRGEPGSGSLPFAAVLERLWGAGYRGVVACEYVPTGATLESLGWVEGVPRVGLTAR